MNTADETVHTMPLEALRARGREAQRLISEARAIARASFSANDPRDAREADDAAHRVGALLDAVARLLPGMPSVAPAAEERGLPRSKPRESGVRRVTLRGGTERALEAIERANILAAIAENTAHLFAEIERGRLTRPLAAGEHIR